MMYVYKEVRSRMASRVLEGGGRDEAEDGEELVIFICKKVGIG